MNENKQTVAELQEVFAHLGDPDFVERVNAYEEKRLEREREKYVSRMVSKNVCNPFRKKTCSVCAGEKIHKIGFEWRLACLLRSFFEAVRGIY